MNKSIVDFLEQEYDYVPVKNGRMNLSDKELESLLIHMAEDTTNTFVQYAIDRLEPYIDFGTLATEIQKVAQETMEHYHGNDL